MQIRSRRRSAEEQLQLIAECRASGLSIAEWCRRGGIRPDTYYTWVERLQAKGMLEKAATVPQRVVQNPYVPDIVKVEVNQPAQTDYSQNQPEQTRYSVAMTGIEECILHLKQHRCIRRSGEPAFPLYSWKFAISSVNHDPNTMNKTIKTRERQSEKNDSKHPEWAIWNRPSRPALGKAKSGESVDLQRVGHRGRRKNGPEGTVPNGI